MLTEHEDHLRSSKDMLKAEHQVSLRSEMFPSNARDACPKETPGNSGKNSIFFFLGTVSLQCALYFDYDIPVNIFFFKRIYVPLTTNISLEISRFFKPQNQYG